MRRVDAGLWNTTKRSRREERREKCLEKLFSFLLMLCDLQQTLRWWWFVYKGKKKMFPSNIILITKDKHRHSSRKMRKKENLMLFIFHMKNPLLASYRFSIEYIEYYSCQAAARINEISIWYHDLPASTIALRSSKSPPLLLRLVLPNNKRRKKLQLKSLLVALCEKRWGPQQMRREYVIILPSNLNSKIKKTFNLRSFIKQLLDSNILFLYISKIFLFIREFSTFIL